MSGNNDKPKTCKKERGKIKMGHNHRERAIKTGRTYETRRVRREARSRMKQSGTCETLDELEELTDEVEQIAPKPIKAPSKKSRLADDEESQVGTTTDDLLPEVGVGTQSDRELPDDEVA